MVGGRGDTYPPAAGILLQKLPKLGQKDVPRCLTLRREKKQSWDELREQAWTDELMPGLSLDPLLVPEPAPALNLGVQDSGPGGLYHRGGKPLTPLLSLLSNSSFKI